jgi:hypothetical protein
VVAKPIMLFPKQILKTELNVSRNCPVSSSFVELHARLAGLRFLGLNVAAEVKLESYE